MITKRISIVSLTLDALKDMGINKRIVNSVRVLVVYTDIDCIDCLKALKVDSNTWHVKMVELEYNIDIAKTKEKDNIKKYGEALAFLKA